MTWEPDYLRREDFGVLLDVLSEAYRCIGPQLRDGALVFDTVRHCSDFPAGLLMEQAPGRCVTSASGSPRWFAWASGPQLLKPLLFAPREVLWRVEQDNHGGLSFTMVKPEPEALAVIGVRACDLAALEIQDRHFLHVPAPDPHYQARREALFLVAVNCSHPAQTCFCASTGDGPLAESGYDLLLWELEEGFLIESGSQRGRDVLAQLPVKPSQPRQREQAWEDGSQASVQVRRLPGRNLQRRLFANLEHPYWEEVAARCLACGNCTSVCPTCFCHRHTTRPAQLAGPLQQEREWSSCFAADHGNIHGYTVRKDTRLRYRQWLTHKLGSWHTQFGRSGCVGCGRCITWCPAGIDLTEAANAICGAS